MKTKDIIVSAWMLLTVTTVQAQITIGGNVFGGARQAMVDGNASVTIHGGNKTDKSDMITITGVYGGNDIAGTVEGGSAVATDGGNLLFVGQLFGGGNGDYDYTQVVAEDPDADEHVEKYRMTHLVWDAETKTWKTTILGYVDAKPTNPEITNAAINLTSGTFGYVYGGGNAATVTGSASITINIPNTIAPLDINGSVDSDPSDDLLSDAELQSMGINTAFFKQNGEFHISRLFGGNNKAEMAIQPTWALNKGKIEYLYSGGNEGKMTSETGLLLKIDPSGDDNDKKQLVIENVFGGCRKADVDPHFQSGDNKGDPVDHVESPGGYAFPRDFAARVLVYGGDVNNVYGGNDVSGHVKFGNAVGVYTSIRGNIYGGGNGSYAYTDNAEIKEKFPLLYGDFYYDVNQLLELPEATSITGMNSAKALNIFRPDAEQVSIRVTGTQDTPTIIGGSIYCGGNSATLKIENAKANDDLNYPKYPIVELKIGSYVVANEVFLGNNGADMVKKEGEDIEDCVLYKYAHGVDNSGNISTSSDALDYSKMDLTNTTDKDSQTGRTQFEEYMEGCAMGMVPSVEFDTGYLPYSTYIGSLYCGGNVGSMTVDGLISIPFNDKVVIFDKVVGGCNNANVPETAVNNQVYNHAYYGGLLNSPEASTGNKLELTFNGLKIQPKRWTENLTPVEVILPNNENVGYPLEWNTVNNAVYDQETKKYQEVDPITTNDFSGASKDAEPEDLNRRLFGGNVYGGCYNTGHVNGNVVINLDATIVDREILFDEVKTDELGEEESLYGDNLLEDQPYKIKQRRTGVILGQQGMDVLGKSLNVFGGGYGPGSEIWGSTTINLNSGYAFQVFGGGESGAIGKGTWNTTTEKFDYTYDPKYSCFINLKGQNDGVSKAEDQSESMAESEFIYGGGFFGTIAGNTVVNLGKGRVFNTFAGSCNADILGHTETYIGRQVKDDSSKDMLNHYLVKDETTGEVTGFRAADNFYVGGFPYIRDIVYGGNDLGGKILGEYAEGANRVDCDFSYRVTDTARGLVHNPGNKANPDVLTASAYVEYTQGRADAIFAGCFGTYDYTHPHYGEFFYATGASDIGSIVPGTVRSGYSKPRMNNAFLNFRPVEGITSVYNRVKEVYGAGQGYPGEADRDKMQNRSYVLIDIPTGLTNYSDMKIYGAGAWGGVGMGVTSTSPDDYSAIVDLMSGKVNMAFGASYKEGFTRRTVVNVPGGITVGEGNAATTLNSTIDIQKIFGGGEGVDEEGYRNIKPCDAFEANVNYNSPTAIVRGAVYGGNNAYRRTLYSKVNINAPVHNGKTDLNGTLMTATVYGAGCGENTWSQYTEVNLNPGAEVYEVYGGGERGKVYNKASVEKWHAADAKISLTETTSGTVDTNPCFDNGLQNTLAIANEDGSKHNTNVHIYEGAIVNNYYITKTNNTTGETYSTWDGGYAYGGGFGVSGIVNSGDVYGTTYIDLLGGIVMKDLYAAGTQGSVMDYYGTPTAKLTDEFDKTFVASSNAFIKGGTARNVYGGGWAGSVGKHVGGLTASYTDDVPGETYIVIGTPEGSSFTNGLPAIERNAYGGGEGGAVWGTTHLIMNNGYIGYRHFDTKAAALADAPDCAVIEVEGSGCYQEKLHDETWYGDQHNRLYDSGCIFGGGYIDNSSVDHTEVRMYGGTVRNSLFGGGEIAAIGRGTVTGIDKIRTLTGIYKAGSTLVGMHDGWVKRNVFGGGRGYNNLGENGKLFSDGYVFGHTEVHIHGGEIGTDEGVSRGEGNVFGGGDIGYVYSAYEDASGHLAVGQKSGTRYDNDKEGYYYKYEGTLLYNTGSKAFVGGNFVSGYPLTEDCKVLVEPECKVKSGYTFGSYDAGSYVPIVELNKLGKRRGTGYDTNWDKLDESGIVIHNAVFAGGNVSSGNANSYANVSTVFGNATASIHDVYHRDLITIGTGHTGGLYGDGNLTFVDGYRGLNITNYGTDYYSIAKEISQAQYDLLPKREQAYYELRYKYIGEDIIRDNDGKDYKKGSTISLDEMLAVFEGTGYLTQDAAGNPIPDPTYWEQNGVCSRYAGRIMNTIQRADFCGVFGSRMVMQGAPDRVVETISKNYTINRVREVSLNKITSKAGDAVGSEGYEHGNYFGIYNVVNNLGNLTSDVDFHTTERTTDADVVTNTQYATDGKTFYGWKEAHHSDRTRNNGKSHNELALASGVYLEIKDMDILEKKSGAVSGDEWGYITGVVELDLLNVQPGIGGGFVYAKNEHGKLKSYSRGTYVTLTTLNETAVTRKDYTYETADANKVEWETSGNFVHSTQVIIDDCYPKSNMYTGTDAMKIHYWYIKGEVYVYDQYITAYTGAPNAYSETVDIPLTITAASNGVMKLLNVQPNLYAYYSSYTGTPGQGGQGVKLSPTGEMEINNVKYRLNDPISYWDWYMLSKAEQRLFVPETYVTIDSCQIVKTGTVYPPGYVMLPEEYDVLSSAAAENKQVLEEGKSAVPAVVWMTKDASGNDVPRTDKNGNTLYKAFDYIFRESNNMRHETGYILTYKVDNPKEWNSYYMRKTASEKTLVDKTGDDDYHYSPTYRYIGMDSQGNPLDGELLGQRNYEIGNLISNEVYQTYQAAKASYPSAIPTNQATFKPAFIMKDEVDDVHKTVNGELVTLNLNPGAAVAEEEFSPADWAKISPHTEAAYISTKTITLSETEYISLNMKMGQTELDNYIRDYPTLDSEIRKSVKPAYYCTVAGSYGGDYYAKNTNYRALAAWSSMSEADRAKFEFNYDAFDLLIDSSYGLSDGRKYQYDLPYNDNGQVDFDPSTATAAQKEQMIYSLEKAVDYQATYNGTDDLYYTPDEGGEPVNAKLEAYKELSRTEYESIPNEQRHYAPITIVNDDQENLITEYYVVNDAFFYGDSNYPVGTIITKSTYDGLLSEYTSKVTKLTFASSWTEEGTTKTLEAGQTYYYCREPYTVNEKGEGADPAPVSKSILTSGNKSWTSGTEVPVGLVINNYSSLPNKQKDFVIHGKSPVETSTLFVSRNSDIFDLSKEKIITVVYQYDYDESDATRNHITPIQERHVVNIHITFKSGAPTVEDISAPKIVMPGTGITMKEPFVTPGAYEVTGGGWELFEDIRDVETHTNGIEYHPGIDPLYWYQDGFYLAYYAQTYLGKTYSNEVQVSVANSHDLKKVMDAKTHHYYIDKSNVKRDPKIYINDYSSTSENGLDMLKSLFDLSVLDDSKVNTDANGLITTIKTADPEDEETTDSPFKGHAPLKDQVKAAQNLEFFMRTNIDYPSTSTWTPIANNAGECFEGTLHGDGYYLNGLGSSLFNHLCGQVYNLGVMGSFTGAGIAESGPGYIENCWIKTTGTPIATSTTESGVTVHHYPVFGNPSRSGTSDLTQVVNCYYPESNNFEPYPETYAPGKATQMPDKSFYNGEVAYNLNGFYLKKRYYDNNTSWTGTKKPYYFFKDVDGTLTLVQNPGNYPEAYAFYPIDEDDASKKVRGYVEDRFADGDFIYASGKIPDDVNKRLYVPTSPTSEIPTGYYPIWPDDYIFFGQRLNFGHDEARPHQDVPSPIVKSPVDPDRILTLLDEEDATNSVFGNRVYRAPAYFRSSKMGVAHFNPNAVFAKSKKGDATVIAYKDMTAIDFTGYHDYSASSFTEGWSDPSTSGSSYWTYLSTQPQKPESTQAFFPPLLDDDGLVGFTNVDLTKNLLAYTGTSAPAVKATNDVVAAKLPDLAYVETNSTYKTAKPWDRYSSVEKIYGHRVELTSGGYVAQNDHFLMDKEDFNAPIAYSFAEDKRMWYQREPENYVGKLKDASGNYRNDAGWEGISLPFTADLVTTDVKGEITHFYKDSRSVSSSGSKTGHEYWLRGFSGGAMSTEAGKENVLMADMKYPGYGNDNITGVTKNYSNTFLWDYYYSYNSYDDANHDDYQEKEDTTYYYKGPHTYENYLRLANGTPYIIGFPGERYYEFDLSGSFSPKNTLSWGVERNLAKQFIIFSSKPGATTIAVSDTEMAGVTKTVDGKTFTFKPSYLNDSELETGKYAFLLNSDGNSYEEDKVNTTVAKVSAFRPYFTSAAVASSGGGGARPVTRSIVFSNDDSELKGVVERGDPKEEAAGTLNIYAKKHKIIVESALTYITDVRIVNLAGMTINAFTIEPGETVETRINTSGVYIVEPSEARFIKKLSVK